MRTNLEIVYLWGQVLKLDPLRVEIGKGFTKVQCIWLSMSLIQLTYSNLFIQSWKRHGWYPFEFLYKCKDFSESKMFVLHPQNQRYSTKSLLIIRINDLFLRLKKFILYAFFWNTQRHSTKSLPIIRIKDMHALDWKIIAACLLIFVHTQTKARFNLDSISAGYVNLMLSYEATTQLPAVGLALFGSDGCESSSGDSQQRLKSWRAFEQSCWGTAWSWWLSREAVLGRRQGKCSSQSSQARPLMPYVWSSGIFTGSSGKRMHSPVKCWSETDGFSELLPHVVLRWRRRWWLAQLLKNSF